MISLGPFPLPAVLLAFATIVALLVARRFKRPVSDDDTVAAPETPVPQITTTSVLIDMLIIGLVIARLAFVLQWLPQYLADPWMIVRIGDGGFTAWAGVLGGLAWGVWKVHRWPALRQPLLAGALSGMVAWGVLAGSLWVLQNARLSVPTTTLTTLADKPIALSEFSGKPLVLNLWATWCPPCRREMPVLAAAQQRHPEVNFVFVNQGENTATIDAYLRGKDLVLRNVLRDPFSNVMREVGAYGLPATLFFDATGKLLDTHLGELSEASLDHKLRRFPIATSAVSPSLGKKP